MFRFFVNLLGCVGTFHISRPERSSLTYQIHPKGDMGDPLPLTVNMVKVNQVSWSYTKHLLSLMVAGHQKGQQPHKSLVTLKTKVKRPYLMRTNVFGVTILLCTQMDAIYTTFNKNKFGCRILVFQRLCWIIQVSVIQQRNLQRNLSSNFMINYTLQLNRISLNLACKKPSESYFGNTRKAKFTYLSELLWFLSLS